MSFIVTRQNYSSMGLNELVVEVAAGGRDGANPGAFAPRDEYAKLGEMDIFVSLSEALEAAIAIAEAWKWDTKKPIMIAIGTNHGGTIPFETEPAEEATYERLRKAAAEYDAKLPRCTYCGDILEEDAIEDEDGEKFCGEYCFNEYNRELCPSEDEEEDQQ